MTNLSEAFLGIIDELNDGLPVSTLFDAILAGAFQ